MSDVDPEVQYHLDRVKAFVEKTSHITVDQWVASKKWLLERGHISDPSVTSTTIATPAAADKPPDNPYYRQVFAKAPGLHGMGRAHITRMSRVKSKPIEWIWDGRVPLGMLSSLNGDPGQGKTFVALALAAAVTRGGELPDGAKAPSGSVIVMNADNSKERILKPRLEQLGADCKRVLHFTDVERLDKTLSAFSMKRDAAIIEDVCASEKDVRLVIIDPISCFLGGTNMNEGTEVREALRGLEKVADAYQLAILLVNHNSKREGAKTLYKSLGSIQFLAAEQIAWVVTNHPKDPKRQLMVWKKSNISPFKKGLAFRIDEESGGLEWSDEVIDWDAIAVDRLLDRPPRESGEGTRGPRGSAKLRALDFIVAALAKGAMLRTAMQEKAQLVGIAKTSFNRGVDLGIKRGDLTCDPRPAEGGPLWLSLVPKLPLDGSPKTNGHSNGTS